MIYLLLLLYANTDSKYQKENSLCFFTLLIFFQLSQIIKKCVQTKVPRFTLSVWGLLMMYPIQDQDQDQDHKNI